MGEVGLLFGLRGKALHLLCASNGVPVSYELTPPANAAEVRLTEELLAEASLGEEVGRKLLGDLAYRSEELEDALAECGVLLVTERSRQHGERQRIEICFSSLKRVFGLGETLAKTLVGLATRIAAKMAAYTPTASTSTASSADRRGGSRSCGLEIRATDI